MKTAAVGQVRRQAGDFRRIVAIDIISSAAPGRDRCPELVSASEGTEAFQRDRWFRVRFTS